MLPIKTPRPLLSADIASYEMMLEAAISDEVASYTFICGHPFGVQKVFKKQKSLDDVFSYALDKTSAAFEQRASVFPHLPAN